METRYCAGPLSKLPAPLFQIVSGEDGRGWQTTADDSVRMQKTAEDDERRHTTAAIVHHPRPSSTIVHRRPPSFSIVHHSLQPPSVDRIIVFSTKEKMQENRRKILKNFFLKKNSAGFLGIFSGGRPRADRGQTAGTRFVTHQK